MAYFSQITINGKIGYKDENGNIVVKPIYDNGQYLTSESDGYYLSVKKDGKCGIIDVKENIIIPIEYEEAYHIFDNLFIVRKGLANKEWVMGVVDSNGATIIPFIYKYVRHFGRFIECYEEATSDYPYYHGGKVYTYSSTQKNGIWYNHLGEVIYNGEGVTGTNDYLIIKEGNKLGVINSDGCQIISCKYTEIYCVTENRFVVRIDEGDSWHFGVIDDHENIIIDFNFRYIHHDSSSFYQCYEEASYMRFASDREKYDCIGDPIWFNKDGNKIHEGKAEILSDEFIKAEREDGWMIITQSKQKIVISYDEVDAIEDKIIVRDDSNVGVLDNRGNVIIEPSYKSIHCAATFEGIAVSGSWHNREEFNGKHSKYTIFDTEKPSIICDIRIYCYSWYRTHLDVCYKRKFDFNELFILHGNNYCELFSFHDGIIANSRFEIIRKLTNTHFAVKQGDLWGVFDGNLRELVIPCEYDRMIYEGGKTICLNKGELWGAKTILPQSNNGIKTSTQYVDIPIQYNEIKELDYAHEPIFGVKWINGRGWNGYTIVNACGQIYDKELIHYRFDKQCEIYDNNLDRILGTIDGKIGFVSTKGYDAIPFQYDEVQRRCDGLFDVRIGRAWGVLDALSGREIVNVKYSKQIPIEFENAIVQNASTYRYGILSKDGTEKIPSIYEHLKVEDDVVFFGYGGYEPESFSNFFGGEIMRAKWGVITPSGKELIPAYYDCYKDAGHFLLAGRDGHMIGSNDSRCEDIHYSDYDGKYDLFTKSGEFIIGGFSEFHYDKDNEVYMFFIGGKWERRTKEVDEWGNYEEYYTYERDNGAWLFLDKNLNSIIKDSKGGQIQFYKGFRFDKEDVLHDANGALLQGIPNEILTKGFHGIQGCNLIIGDDFSYADSEGVYYNRYAALNMITGKQTPYYEKLESIGKSKHLFLLEHGDYMRVEEHEEVALHKDFFYFLEGNKVGVCNYKSTILPAEYLFISNPVDGFYLAAKEIDEEYSCLTLFSFNDCSFKLSIIPKILTSELIKATKYTSLEVEAKNVDKTILSEYAILAQTYVEDASSNNPYWSFAKINYFTDDYRLRKDTYCSMDYYDDYDRPDYAGDTWDAMTDGMYGDMPDDFDGDYSFLGR